MALKPEAARPKGWREILPAFEAGIAETNAGCAKIHADELAARPRHWTKRGLAPLCSKLAHPLSALGSNSGGEASFDAIRHLLGLILALGPATSLAASWPFSETSGCDPF